jgi:inosose dehydratase
MQSLTSSGAQVPRGLAQASIGIVPVLWNNSDLSLIGTPTQVVVDEVARLSYAGIQLASSGEARGAALRDICRAAGVRVAEHYAALACGEDGPSDAALASCRRALSELVDADGEVLVLACAFDPVRVVCAARADGPATPRLRTDGWKRLSQAVDLLAREAGDAGKRLSFHNHAGTFVETPGELEQLAAMTDARTVGLCLDVGHYVLAGGDPVAALRGFGDRVDHIHLKDVSAEVRAGMRDGSVAGFMAGLRKQVFTELGSGMLDLEGVLRVLAARDYSGWLMVEQDTTARTPAESAAISRAALAVALAHVAVAG